MNSLRAQAGGLKGCYKAQARHTEDRPKEILQNDIEKRPRQDDEYIAAIKRQNKSERHGQYTHQPLPHREQQRIEDRRFGIQAQEYMGIPHGERPKFLRRP